MFEGIEPKKKKSILLPILSIFVLIAAISSVAVAVWNWTYTSSNANSITTGNISMSLLESTDVINITNAVPMTDEEGKALGTGGKFDFAVTTSTTGAPGNMVYSISITKLAASTGYTALPDNNVKIYLTTFDGSDETVVMSPTLVSNIITSGDTGTLTFDSGKESYLTHSHTSAGVNHTTKYRLRMWVDENVDASSWNENTKYEYRLKINVSGSLTA